MPAGFVGRQRQAERRARGRENREGNWRTLRGREGYVGRRRAAAGPHDLSGKLDRAPALGQGQPLARTNGLSELTGLQPHLPPRWSALDREGTICLMC